MLRTIKAEGGLSEIRYKRLYPISAGPLPEVNGLPKIHKKDIPLRPIVSSWCAVTYVVAKELTNIIRPLVGHSPNHIRNTQDFVDQVQSIRLGEGE